MAQLTAAASPQDVGDTAGVHDGPDAPVVADDLDVVAVRADFPLLVGGDDEPAVVFLDSAASSQKPRQVLEAMDAYYAHDHANVHRAAYALAERATNAMEGARTKVARFIGASTADEVVFTKNATESINLVARSWGAANLGPGDAVVLTQLEHHANIVPWHQLAAERGIELRWIPLTEDAQLDLSDLDRLLDGAKLLSVSAMSNVVGTIPDVRQLADAAHAAGALVCVDACQYVPHVATDVLALGADFLAFSGHKMCGPTGVGALWARRDLLESMPPFLGGGGMILDVSLDGFVAADVPHKFEAGTPPIAEIVGLGAAVDYLDAVGMDRVRAHEVALTDYALRTLTERFGDDLTVHGPTDPALRGGVMSFAFRGIHPHDLSQVLDSHGVCVRPGHHCAKPLMRVLGVGATARASWYLYNDEADVDALGDALAEAGDFFDF
jgi:cysteine desulfurase / selenocysteine lyase